MDSGALSQQDPLAALAAEAARYEAQQRAAQQGREAPLAALAHEASAYERHQAILHRNRAGRVRDQEEAEAPGLVDKVGGSMEHMARNPGETVAGVLTGPIDAFLKLLDTPAEGELPHDLRLTKGGNPPVSRPDGTTRPKQTDEDRRTPATRGRGAISERELIQAGVQNVANVALPGAAKVIGRFAGPLAGTVAAGAGFGAAYSPEDPMAGAVTGGIVGAGMHGAGAAGARAIEATVPDIGKGVVEGATSDLASDPAFAEQANPGAAVDWRGPKPVDPMSAVAAAERRAKLLDDEARYGPKPSAPATSAAPPRIPGTDRRAMSSAPPIVNTDPNLSAHEFQLRQQAQLVRTQGDAAQADALLAQADALARGEVPAPASVAPPAPIATPEPQPPEAAPQLVGPDGAPIAAPSRGASSGIRRRPAAPPLEVATPLGSRETPRPDRGPRTAVEALALRKAARERVVAQNLAADRPVPLDEAAAMPDVIARLAARSGPVSFGGTEPRVPEGRPRAAKEPAATRDANASRPDLPAPPDMPDMPELPPAGGAGEPGGAPTIIPQEAVSTGEPHGWLPEMKGASPETKTRFTRDVEDALHDPETGEDAVARVVREHYGTPLGDVEKSPGLGMFKLEISPNTIHRLAAGTADAVTRTYAALKGLVLNQDAQMWFRRARAAEAPGVAERRAYIVSAEGGVTPEQFRALRNVIANDPVAAARLHGATLFEGHVLFENTDKALPEAEYARSLREAIARAPGDFDVRGTHVVGEYLDGHQELERAAGGRADALRSAARVIRTRVAPVYERWAGELGLAPAEVRARLEATARRLDGGGPPPSDAPPVLPQPDDGGADGGPPPLGGADRASPSGRPRDPAPRDAGAAPPPNVAPDGARAAPPPASAAPPTAPGERASVDAPASGRFLPDDELPPIHHEDVAPHLTDEEVRLNLDKFTQDPSGQRELQASLARSGAKRSRLGFVEMREEAARFADELGLAKDDVDLSKMRKLSGPQIVGMKILVSRNLDLIEGASRTLERGGLSDEAFGRAAELVERARAQNDALLATIARESSQRGRDLGFLRQIANRSLDPAVWMVQARRLLGDVPMSDAVQADIMRLVREAFDACGGG